MKQPVENFHQSLELLFFNSWVVKEVADFILELEPQWQEYVLGWVLEVAKTQPEIAYQYALKASHALDILGQEGTESWLQSSLDVYFSDGLYAAVQVIKNLELFIEQHQQQQRGLALAKIRAVLQNFLYGLDGRNLEIRSSDIHYTDTERVYLPEMVDRFELEADNFSYYKLLAVHLWAQTWYGTWRLDIAQLFANQEHMLGRFHYLETIRLNACIACDYPGLWRQMQHLHALTGFKMPVDKPWQAIITQLSQKSGGVEDSLQLLKLIRQYPQPQPFCYQGILRPLEVQRVKADRLVREQNLFRLTLAKIADDQARDCLPHIYDDTNCVVIDDIHKLPYRISDIYRGLTS